MKYFNLFSFMKSLILILILNSTAACANDKSETLDSFIGLYEVVNARCEVAEGAFGPCQGTLFFEILKGQFYGINDDDLGYVFWNGDSKLGGELSYTSHKIDSELMVSDDGKLWLNKEGDSEEYLTFFEGVVNGYHLKYKVGDKIRTISYELNSVKRGNKLPYIINYLGKE